MIVVVYTDEGPGGPTGQTTEAMRACRSAWLFDSREAMEEFLRDKSPPSEGRKRPRIEAIDTDDGDVVRDERNPCPLPSPVSDERLAEMLACVEARLDPEGGRRFSDEQALLEDFVTHLDFLHRILADDVPAAAVREAYARGRERGFGEGAEAQRKADVKAASIQAKRILSERIEAGVGPSTADAVRVVNAVSCAPLATPDAK